MGHRLGSVFVSRLLGLKHNGLRADESLQPACQLVWMAITDTLG